MAGMADETPFDYDHLVPSAHWAGWTGEGNNAESLTQFEEEKGSLGYTGNCIGNLHVLDSRVNRSLGDSPLAVKLEKIGGFAEHGLILKEDENWIKASPSTNYRVWGSERAFAFQRAVEQRAFDLYEKFYSALQCNGV